jgi:hypothetical protein
MNELFISRKPSIGGDIYVSLSGLNGDVASVNNFETFAKVFSGAKVSLTVGDEADYPEIYFYEPNEVYQATQEFMGWFSDVEYQTNIPSVSKGIPFGELTETGNFFVYTKEDNLIYYFDHDDYSEFEEHISSGFQEFVKMIIDKDLKLISRIYCLV